jgi:hypothetical protein
VRRHPELVSSTDADQAKDGALKRACDGTHSTQRLPPDLRNTCRRAHNATSTSPVITGTSINGPITAANAAPLSIPKVATANAIANSKLFDAAVKDRVAVCPYDAQAFWLNQNQRVQT